MAKKLVCPKCGSVKVDMLDSNDKKFSAGKAGLGGCLLGPFGLLFGLAGKKGIKQFRCTKCGTVFKKKLK